MKYVIVMKIMPRGKNAVNDNTIKVINMKITVSRHALKEMSYIWSQKKSLMWRNFPLAEGEKELGLDISDTRYLSEKVLG